MVSALIIYALPHDI